MLDVGWGDLIDYLGDDPNTKSIVIYMETIGDARAFLSAAREVALTKPIIVIKPGRTAAGGARPPRRTPGSLTGSDDVLDAAFRRAGVLRVDSIDELFYVAEILAKQPRPTGRRLTIVTNAGGPGVLATDALIGGGGELSELSPDTMDRARTRSCPPPGATTTRSTSSATPRPSAMPRRSRSPPPTRRPTGCWSSSRPQAMTDPTATARALVRHARIAGKPVLAVWMGGTDVDEGAAILREAGHPDLPVSRHRRVLFNHLWRYAENLRSLYETPSLPGRARARRVPRRGRPDHRRRLAPKARTILTEYESKKVLAAYGIPITDTQIAVDRR